MTQRVTVKYHCEPDGWWAECGAMQGWSAAGVDADEVRTLAREAVALHFGAPVVTVSAFILTQVHVPGLAVDPAGSETLEIRSEAVA